MFVMFCLVALFVLIGWVLVIKELLKSNKKTASGSHGFDELYMQQQRFAEESTREALKSVTPFEMGGYNLNQGNLWNDNGCNNFNGSGNGMFQENQVLVQR